MIGIVCSLCAVRRPTGGRLPGVAYAAAMVTVEGAGEGLRVRPVRGDDFDQWRVDNYRGRGKDDQYATRTTWITYDMAPSDGRS